jgi:hypothetical protein
MADRYRTVDEVVRGGHLSRAVCARLRAGEPGRVHVPDAELCHGWPTFNPSVSYVNLTALPRHEHELKDVFHAVRNSPGLKEVAVLATGFSPGMLAAVNGNAAITGVTIIARPFMGGGYRAALPGLITFIERLDGPGKHISSLIFINEAEGLIRQFNKPPPLPRGFEKAMIDVIPDSGLSSVSFVDFYRLDGADERIEAAITKHAEAMAEAEAAAEAAAETETEPEAEAVVEPEAEAEAKAVTVVEPESKIVQRMLPVPPLPERQAEPQDDSSSEAGTSYTSDDEEVAEDGEETEDGNAAAYYSDADNDVSDSRSSWDSVSDDDEAYSSPDSLGTGSDSEDEGQIVPDSAVSEEDEPPTIPTTPEVPAQVGTAKTIASSKTAGAKPGSQGRLWQRMPQRTESYTDFMKRQRDAEVLKDEVNDAWNRQNKATTTESGQGDGSDTNKSGIFSSIIEHLTGNGDNQ